MTISRVRDAKHACPICKNFLKTDGVALWCENASCDFTGLYGELEELKEVLRPETRKLSRREQTAKLMGVGYREPITKPPIYPTRAPKKKPDPQKKLPL